MTADRHTARRAIALLAVLVLSLVAAFTLGASPAVADSGSLAGTRVAGFDLGQPDGVGASGDVSAGQGRETTADSYDSALGCCVATKGTLPDDPRINSNDKRGRFDASWDRFDDAVRAARDNAGTFEPGSQMFDPGTGTLIGERSADLRQGWRIDNNHLNWWDWTGGKKGAGGRYGHEFFPAEQAGPHSAHIGYAPWERC